MRESLIRAYLDALASAAQGDALARFFTADAEQVELPSRLNPNGQRSDLAHLLERAQRVPGLLSAQRFDIVSMVLEGDRAAVEATWRGTLAIALGGLPAGATMTAHFAMFFEFEGDRIRRQRNYDCFEPW